MADKVRALTEAVASIPNGAIRPDVAVLHAARADLEGNAQARAARRVIVTVEELVDGIYIGRKA